MKKILVSMFLLVFGLCLVGCEQLHTGPKEDIIIDGEYYAKVIYNSPFLSSSAYSRKIIIDNNKLDDLEFNDYELQGDFFASIPNSDKDVFSSVTNIEEIWFAEVLQPEDIDGETGYYLTLVNSNYYLYYGRYTEDNGYSIKHAFKLIRLDTEKEILCDFLTLFNPLSVTLINGEDNSMIDKSYYDFESQLFFEEFMQIEVSKLDNFEKYDMPNVDYYISFSTFTEDFVSLQFYNVKNSDYEQYYGRIDGNLLDGIYQFSINEELFNKVFDYFTNNTKFEESLYKLTIQNDSSNELIGIKEEYKAGEEVVVKMEYDMAVETYVFLNGELLGTLNGSNSLKFNMPEKDSTLVVTYTNAEIYKVNVIDNFNLLRKPLKSYYIPGEEVEVILQFLSGPRVGIVLNGNKIETTGELVEGLGELFTFTMPNTDSVIYITYNDIICNPDNDEHHKWDEGKHQQVPGGGHDELVYTCEYCGYHKYVDFTYEMQIEELATIVENEFKTLNTEKIIIKDLIKMLEDIFLEYDLTDTQIKEIEVCVSVLEKLDEFDEITKEELEELYKNPDISDNVE